ncbi:hypothetical protein B0H16DRAFT_1645079 [Mycena metata]|uniref:DUF6533 domain-containing protein n=1 Tax=Mycena metata TaxID=1033252 RepID=A0AAD7DS45_9AGAR|nr:hypothetical protein B0H16DRAFT_1645079 [Mycena metata]
MHPMNTAPLPDVNDDIAETLRTNYVGFAAFSILIWDHVDTFTTEVKYIWKGQKGIIAYLFLLNRYLTPLGFMVNLFAYLSPVWTGQRCKHFIRFEGAMTVIGIHVVAIMMLLRIKALYSTQRIVVGCVFLLFMIMFVVNAWLLTRGQPVEHNPHSGVRACTMIFPPSLSVIASSSAWLPLLYDSVILVLTLMKTVPLVGKRKGTFMVKRLLEDGILYYTAIFSVTLVLTIMIISAPPGLKNIAAQLELLVTVTMMSRITLNLKKCAQKRLESTILQDPGPIVFQTLSSPIRMESYRNPGDW